MILNCPFAGYVHFFPCLVCVCVCVWCSNPHKSMKIGLTQRQAEQVRAQEYLLVCIWLAKKIHSDFLLHCVEKPKQTFGPTLYLLCPLLQTALHCSASPLEGTVVMAMKADLQRWVYKNETYIKGKKRDESFTEDIINSAELERAKKEEDRMHPCIGIVILMIVLLGKYSLKL